MVAKYKPRTIRWRKRNATVKQNNMLLLGWRMKSHRMMKRMQAMISSHNVRTQTYTPVQ